jgi:hypothetical protein
MNLEKRLKISHRNGGVSLIEKVANKNSSAYDKPAITKGQLIREKEIQRKNTFKKTRLGIKVAVGKMPFVMLK